jgi:hypothetical protein
MGHPVLNDDASGYVLNTLFAKEGSRLSATIDITRFCTMYTTSIFPYRPSRARDCSANTTAIQTPNIDNDNNNIKKCNKKMSA